MKFNDVNLLNNYKIEI